MRSLRFSLRGLMVLIALLAVSLAALATINRSVGRGGRLWRQARILASIGTRAREHATKFRSCPHPKPDWCMCCDSVYYGEGLDEATLAKKRAAVHSETVRRFDSIAKRADSMALQYFYAADRPWVGAPILPGEAGLKSEAFDLFEQCRSNADSY